MYMDMSFLSFFFYYFIIYVKYAFIYIFHVFLFKNAKIKIYDIHMVMSLRLSFYLHA